MPTVTVRPGYDYADVAAAVCRLLGLSPRDMSSVLARVRNFSRLRIFPDKPMRQGAITCFDTAEALDLCLATVMGYSGIGPTDAIKIIQESRGEIHSLAEMGAPFTVKRPYVTMNWEVGQLKRELQAPMIKRICD